jgi:hypothetical protein
MHVPTPASIWHGVVDYAGWPEEHKRPGYLLSEFSIAVVWLGPLGLLHLARRHRRMLWISVLAYSGPVAYTFVYEIPDIHVYYLVPHALLAAWLACGLRIIAYTLRRGLRRVHLPGGSRRRLMALFSAGWLGLAVMAGSVNLRATDLSRDRVADGFAASILGRMAPAALVLTTGDDWSFPLLYARHVEGARQDVLVLPAVFFLQRNYRLVTRLRREGLEVVDPECARRARDPDAHIWCRLRHVASRNLARRPVYLIGPTVEEFVRNHAESDRWPPYARVAEGVPVLRFRAPEVGDASRRRHADHGSDGHSP